MLHDLDATLTNILHDPAAPARLRTAVVAFKAPDRKYVDGLGTTGTRQVNLFLHRLQENTALRETTPEVRVVDGIARRRLPLLRVDCSFLVTAWDPARDVRREHELLSLALRWLTRFEQVPVQEPAAYQYLAGALRTVDYPATMLSARLDPQRMPADFWTALGIPPQPSFDLTATIAIDPQFEEGEDPVVAHRHVDLGSMTAPWDELKVIGGRVTRTGPPERPVAEAVVTLDGTPYRTVTKDDGRFTLAGVPEGRFLVKVQVAGLPIQMRTVRVPSQNPEEYNFKFNG